MSPALPPMYRPPPPPTHVADDPARPPPTVTYFAISLWNSRTFRVNAVLALVALVPLLADPDLIASIPPKYLVLYALFVKIANIGLRLVTVRPVALIPPGATVAVEVAKIVPPTTTEAD